MQKYNKNKGVLQRMKDCIFCKISKGEIPSYVIYEDSFFKVILDRFPAAKGHCLIIPKSHYRDVFDIPEDLLEKVYPLAKKMAFALKEALGVESVNILQNNGEMAGQTVMHFHLHLIPRKEKDEVLLNQSAQTDTTLEELEAVAKKLQAVLK